MRILTLLFVSLVFAACKEKPQPSFASTSSFGLAAPQIKASKMLFQNATEVSIHFSMKEANIKYTLDGSEVTEQSPSYIKPLILSESTTLKTKSFHQDYKESPTKRIEVRKIKENISSATISSSPQPNERYQGGGAKSLIDLQKGSLQFSTNSWLGYQTETVSLQLKFSQPRQVSNIIVSGLSSHDSWIFLPESISVQSKNKTVGTLTLKAPIENEANVLRYIKIPIEANQYTDLTITILPLNKIPQWHQGKDTPAWFFVDEIMIE